MTGRPLAVAAALLVMALGACSRPDPEPASIENTADDVAETPDVPSSERPAEAIEANDTAGASASANASAEVPPDEATPPSIDEQTMDDAAATGMTARATRDDRAVTDDDAPIQNDTE